MDASETTTEMLRAAIESALRRRDPCADVCSGDAPNGFSGRDASACVMHGYAASRGDSDDEALRRLARLVGLRDDGSDPAQEVERLTREVAEARADAARAREAYTIDLAGLRDALRRADDDRTRWRERVAELRTDNARLDDVTRGALDDLARVRAELAAIRAAVRELRDAEAALLTSLDSEIQSGEALPMTDESLRALKARMRPELERIEAARSALDALTREP